VEGSIGAQGSYRNLSVLGEAPFLQPTHTLQLALFDFEELKLERWRFQLGARAEFNRVSIDSSDPALTSLRPGDSTQKTFVPLSVAAGIIYDITPDTNAALTLRYSERAPTAEELFANGPHDATFQFLFGDPNLAMEKVLGLDLSLRKKEGKVTGSVSAYYNHFFNFIDFNNTGAIQDNLPVYDYAGKRADFWGGEALVDYHLLPRTVTQTVQPAAMDVKSVVAPGGGTETANPNDLYIELKGDYVHAQNLTDGEPLPRISPARATAAVAYASPKYGARLEVQHVFAQNRVASLETPTAGYTFLNADVSYNFANGPVNYSFYIRGVNLTNAVARDHTSFLKDVLPLSGVGVMFGIRATF
jgi:iron complex outermembrane receptor protein